jgi:hypothetical protein
MCSNNGNCTDKGCLCNQGYIGEDCLLKSCSNDCTGNGDCDFKTGKCHCSEGYLGESCQEKVCIKNCSNNGECVDGVCHCKELYYGSHCDKSKFIFIII